jgi:hypothetical protein
MIMAAILVKHILLFVVAMFIEVVFCSLGQQITSWLLCLETLIWQYKEHYIWSCLQLIRLRNLSSIHNPSVGKLLMEFTKNARHTNLGKFLF